MRWILLDRLEYVDPGKCAVAIKTFSRADLLFMDHFPGKPIVPGVLEIEMIAQTAAKAVKLALPDALLLLSNVHSARFLRPIKPGDQCRITANILKQRSNYMCAAGYVEVQGTKVGQAELVCAVVRDSTSTAADAVIEEWMREQGEQEKETGRGQHNLEENPASPPERSPAMPRL